MADRSRRTEKWHLDGMPTRITALLESESARGGILILGAYLEDLLSELIRAASVSEEIAEKLMEFRGPAGDFNSKILLCASFGLIHESEAKALHAVRRIRNQAAHFDRKGKGFDVLFDTKETSAQVSNLANAMNLSLRSREPEAVQGMFEVSTRLLATKIMIRAIQAKQPQPVQTIKQIANEFRVRMAGTEVGERIGEMEEQSKQGDFEAISNYFKAVAQHLRSRLNESDPRDESV